MEPVASGRRGCVADRHLCPGYPLSWHLRVVGAADRGVHDLVRPLWCSEGRCSCDRRSDPDVLHVRDLVPGAAAEGAARKLSGLLSGAWRIAGTGRPGQSHMLEDIGNLFHGFGVVAQPFNLMLMVVGIVLGVIVGVLPGLGGANGVAILLPLTFSMSPTSAIIMLSCIYWGALFGGAITSVLFNLTGAFTSSFVGALVAVLMFTFLAPLVAKFALQFGPPEFFSVYLLTFCSFVGMGKGSAWKTLAAMMLGFALAAIGMDNITGRLRLTFGFPEMMRGVDFLIAVIGLFGIGEILLSMEEGLAFSGHTAKINPKIVLETWKKLPRYWATSLRGCIIGCWMGIIPGGATPASFMSYGVARKVSKDGARFGSGQLEGV